MHVARAFRIYNTSDRHHAGLSQTPLARRFWRICDLQYGSPDPAVHASVSLARGLLTVCREEPDPLSSCSSHSAAAGALDPRLVLYSVFTPGGTAVSLQYDLFGAVDTHCVAAGTLQAYISPPDACILIGNETGTGS